MSKPIIIDACVLSKVFCSSAQGHEDFQPVLEALHKGKCFMIFGGSKFLGEMAKLKKLVSLFNIMKKNGMLKHIDDKRVDLEQRRVEQIITHPDFDDPHLPAMSIIGNCHLICTDDERCMPHLKRRDLYSTHFRTPRFYSRIGHKKLLYDRW